MIKEFVELWESRKHMVQSVFEQGHPGDYKEIVKAVIGILNDDSYGYPDVERIHEITEGDYRGVLVYVIAASGYQPSDHWYVKVGYGSCSGCDTLEAIRTYSDEPPNEEQIRDYMTLALHIIQGLKKMGEVEA